MCVLPICTIARVLGLGQYGGEAASNGYVQRNSKKRPVRLPKVTNARKVFHKCLGVNLLALCDAACSRLVLGHHAISVKVLALDVPQYLGKLQRETVKISNALCRREHAVKCK